MAQLRHYQSEFERLDTQILLLCFGTEPQAHNWLRETEARFPLLLDPTREIYRAYHLKRSILRVWLPNVVWHYLPLLWRGQRLRWIQGDPHQLGGDFVVSKTGRLAFAYPSSDPTDRPSIEALIRTLERLAAR